MLENDIYFRCAKPYDKLFLVSNIPTFPIRGLEKEGHLIIVAIQGTIPIGYIHFSLGWLNLNVNDGGNSTNNTDEELIFTIWDLYTNNKMNKDKDTILNIALISLSLENIKKDNAYYGLLETSNINHQKIYTKYFNMEYKHDIKKNTFIISCDLSRYSYKYAMSLWKEDYNSRIDGDDENELTLDFEEKDKEQRVLIKMPSLDECYEYFNNYNNSSLSLFQQQQSDILSSNIRKKRLSCSSNATNKSSCSNVTTTNKRCYLSNPSSHNQATKKLKIQVHLKSNHNNNYVHNEEPHFNDEENVIFKRYYVSENNELLEGNKNITTSTSSTITTPSMEELERLPEWILIKRFPLQNKEVKPPPMKTNLILQDLTTKLNKVTQIEQSLQPKLLHFLNEIYNEKVEYYSRFAIAQRKKNQYTLKECDALLARQRDADLAWKIQQEQDMDAVCDVCGDGEVTPENQILFCERCNIAIHQRCYMIEKVPEGDYFCKVCRLIEDEKDEKNVKDTSIIKDTTMTKPLPVSCQLCPRKQGAFVRVNMSSPNPYRCKSTVKFDKNNSILLPKNSQWVHVVCAKWQGLNYVDSSFEMVENVSTLKNYFLDQKIKCCLCKGMRGAYNKCSHKDCNNYMHITCARAFGLCTVKHGENSSGVIQSDDSWLLLCPEHSKKTDGTNNSNDPGYLTLEQLEMAAKAFPKEEKLPKYKLKPFNKLTTKERELFLKDPDCEAEFLPMLMDRLEGARCEVCYCRDDLDMKDAPMDTTDQHVSSSNVDGQAMDTEEHITTRGKVTKPKPKLFNTLTRCAVCRIVLHTDCYINRESADGKTKHKHNVNVAGKKDFVCDACQYTKEYDDKETPLENPSCHMCNQEGGALKKAYATPTTMKKWTGNNANAFKKSLFGKQIWCHAVCGMWHPACIMADNKFNCTNIIMSNGKRHIHANWECCLCGGKDKVKLACDGGHDGTCQAPNKPFRFHLSCARQAGFEADDSTEPGNDVASFHVKCYQHKSNMHAIRARLEDFIELEKLRIGMDFEKIDKSPMTIAHAARLHHWAVSILQIFGWAWRWAEWWVEVGDTWEPLLEEGQKEELMTKEQLRIVDSTKESRCEDARRCRLAPFGAALRNRNYDTEENGGKKELHNALRAIFHTPSLVGPLQQYEIDFFVDWLGRAYRSKSPLLGFGDNKITCSPSGGCIHIIDGSPKYELGKRPLPGRNVQDGEPFEIVEMEEPDDFLQKRLNIDAPTSASPHPIEAPSSATINCATSKKKRKENEISESAMNSSSASDTDRKRRKARAATANNSLYVQDFLDDDEPVKVVLPLK